MTEIVQLPPPPASYHNDNDLWLDEQIWGHRLWEQDPWLLFLEFLSVAEASHAAGQAVQLLFCKSSQANPLG